MKNTALHIFWSRCLILIGTGFFAISSAAEPSDDFHQAFLDHITLKVTTHAEQYVGSVIRTPVETVRFEAFAAHSPSPKYGVIDVFEIESELIPVEVPSTTQKLPWFDELIHPDFRLTEESANTFLDMLQSIMPDHFFDEFDGDRIQQTDTGEWIFMTGEFFTNLKGFVVTTNDDGKITSVSYSLEL